ncbi:hypothetical protein AALO_G00296460 [Alosa alosa]|uniref:Uncharacterized protein n=1 Tax=Alosa alosa TaxID=278164 RepID=A0AAV6FDC6_9TELE|nr:hypothetical protein AALO_G00296460 [Alosa alosa]
MVCWERRLQVFVLKSSFLSPSHWQIVVYTRFDCRSFEMHRFPISTNDWVDLGLSPSLPEIITVFKEDPGPNKAAMSKVSPFSSAFQVGSHLILKTKPKSRSPLKKGKIHRLVGSLGSSSPW